MSIDFIQKFTHFYNAVLPIVNPVALREENKCLPYK